MTTGNPPETPGDAKGAPFFSARLTPHRSLGRNGFLALMLFVGAVMAVCGLLFFVIGAWPVVGFCGVDVLVVWFAFRVNYARARAYEEVHVSPYDVHLRRVGHRGEIADFHFNPAWARLHVTRIEDEGVVALRLVSHGRAVDVGRFLNPPDRESFADAFSRALALARRGGPDLSPA